MAFTYLELDNLLLVFSIASQEWRSLVQVTSGPSAGNLWSLRVVMRLLLLVQLVLRLLGVDLLVKLMELLLEVALSRLALELQIADLKLQLLLVLVELILAHSDLLQVLNQLFVVVTVLDDTSLGLSLNLGSGRSQSLNCLGHISKLSVELLDGLGTLPLSRQDLLNMILDKQLVNLHEVFNAPVVILVLVRFVHMVDELVDGALLFLRLVLLALQLFFELLHLLFFSFLILFQVSERFLLVREAALKFQQILF